MKLTPLQIVFFLILILAMLVGLYTFVGWIMLKVNHRYTVGVTAGIGNSTRGPVDVMFNFNVKGKQYVGGTGASVDRKDRKGACFLVRYCPFHPRWSEMDFRRPIDTSVIKPPFDGWDEIPEELKKKNQH